MKSAATSLLDIAQRQWLVARDARDLAGVRRLLREALAHSGSEALNKSETELAWTRLILLLLQENDESMQAEAHRILVMCGFRFRLAPACLMHMCPRDAAEMVVCSGKSDAQQAIAGTGHAVKVVKDLKREILPAKNANRELKVFAVDNFLPELALEALQRLFARDNRFWNDHRYEDPATGYEAVLSTFLVPFLPFMACSTC